MKTNSHVTPITAQFPHFDKKNINVKANSSTARISSTDPAPCPLFIAPDVWRRVYYHSVARRALIFLDENVGEPICLTRVSAAVSMETTAFARAFRRNTGMTFMRFAQAYRISVFVARLERSDDPITIIAQECGFNSLVTLERAFKKLVGQTPSSYRSQFLESQLLLPVSGMSGEMNHAKERRQSANS